jgi:hypothetical protein
MNSEQNHIETELLARLAGITVPDARLPLLTGGLAGILTGVKQLRAHDLGQAEPADRFQPPRP